MTLRPKKNKIMKDFLNPTVFKITLAFVLFLVFSWLWRMAIPFIISDTFPLGVPLSFFLSWGPCRPGENCSEFNGMYLVLDIGFWYIVGSVLVAWFRKK
ncbi:MAG: hypothetical protein HY865_12970 [Chloroflexi bacterium]|nr:hypothetical protein [Chloroflexota bacterium]